MVEIIKLDKSYQQEFIDINKVICENLVNALWFMPFSEENLKNTFDENSSLTVYGAKVDGKLACVSVIDKDDNEWLELCDAIGIKSENVAEIGGSMTLPSYRGQGLMTMVNQKLIEVSKEMGLEYLVATAHPDNIASNKSLAKIGMECKTQIMRAGKYLRKVYMMKL